jgi:cell fate (sporulation/competence/biofilm development) regulator YlbF (YheA/YmcA/DUF963 family)
MEENNLQKVGEREGALAERMRKYSASSEPIKLNSQNSLEITKAIMDASYSSSKVERVRAVPYQSLDQSLRQVNQVNNRLEHAMNMEILGIRNDFCGRFKYALSVLGNYISGKENIRAESIIDGELGQLEGIALGLEFEARKIEEKTDELSKHRRHVSERLLGRIENREKTIAEVEDIKGILNELEINIQNTEGAVTRIKYENDRAEMRKHLQKRFYSLKETDREILNLKDELPRIENIGDVGYAHVNAIREINQDASNLIEHFRKVKGVYLDIMRAGRADETFQTSLKTNIEMLKRVSDSMSQTAVKKIQEANSKGRIGEFLDYNTQSLTKSRDIAIEANERSWSDLDSEVTRYLSGKKDISVERGLKKK